MTTFMMIRIPKPLRKTQPALAGLMACLALAGCESGGAVLPGGGNAPLANISDPQTASPTNTANSFQIVPVTGSPDNVSSGLQSKLIAKLQQKGLSVVPKGTASKYVLRGYIVASRESSGSKLSYIWDVTDSAGKRLHRIKGSQVAGGKKGADPWSSVTPAVIDAIASKTADELAQWVPNATGSVPVASNAPAGSPGTYSNSAQSSGSPTTLAQAARTPTSGTTGSIGATGPASAMVPAVTGAPGDGGVALTSAIQRELSRNGVSLASVPAANTYRVQGNVAIGQSQDGKQPIQIDWTVVDPSGKKLGTVTQKNQVPQGTLDGAWGKTADAAASAAAQGILKLLPKKSTN